MIFQNPLFIVCVSVDKNIDEIVVGAVVFRKRYILVMSKTTKDMYILRLSSLHIALCILASDSSKGNVEGFFGIFGFYFSVNKRCKDIAMSFLS